MKRQSDAQSEEDRACPKCGKNTIFVGSVDALKKWCPSCKHRSDVSDVDQIGLRNYSLRDPSAEPIDSLCAITGLDRIRAGELLTTEPELARRIFRAYDEQRGGKTLSLKFRLSNLGLHDPVEDDPRYSEAIKRIDADRKLRTAIEPFELGSCHRTWNSKKRLLYEKLGIEWFSPSEMNPQDDYD